MTRFSVGGALAPAAFLLAATAAPAAAQQPVCGPRAALVEMLAKRYGERLRVIARENRGYVVELHTGPTGTWTLLISRPDGRSCAVAAGRDHKILPPGKAADGAGRLAKPGVPAPAPKTPDVPF